MTPTSDDARPAPPEAVMLAASIVVTIVAWVATRRPQDGAARSPRQNRGKSRPVSTAD